MIKSVKFGCIRRKTKLKLESYAGFSDYADQPFGNGQRWIELRIPGRNRVVLFTPLEPKIVRLQEYPS